MEILLRNIQSIEEAEYVLPDTGFVKISGGNSNGKSILIKTIHAIATLEIADKEVRRALINDDSTEASVIITYKGKILIVKLHEERDKCFVCLTREDNEQIIRNFREGGIQELLYEFGFRTYNNNQICLQVYETFGLTPFVNTSATVNSEVVEAVTEDSVAKDFMTKFKEITHKKAKTLISSLNEKIDTLTLSRRSILTFDYKAYEAMDKRLTELYSVLENLEPVWVDELDIPAGVSRLEIPEMKAELIEIPKAVKLVDVTHPELVAVDFASKVDLAPAIENVSILVGELVEALNGKCPTCGRPFVEGGME